MAAESAYRKESGSRTVPSAEEMRELGAELGKSLRAGDLVILDGPLGAGKTTMTQGIARGMGVRGRVTSPTFTIAREHRPLAGASSGCSLIHVDAYRLFGEEGPQGSVDGEAALDALDSLDLDTDLDSCVVVAEWGTGLADQLADRYLLVTLDRSAADDNRFVAWRWVDEAENVDQTENNPRTHRSLQG